MRNLVLFVKTVHLRGGQHRLHLVNRLVAKGFLVQLFLHHRSRDCLNCHRLQLRIFHHHVNGDALLPKRPDRLRQNLTQRRFGVKIDFRCLCGNLVFARRGRQNAVKECLRFVNRERREVVVNRGPLLFLGNHLVALEGLPRDDVDVGGVLLLVQHSELLRPRHRFIRQRGGVADAAAHECRSRIIGRAHDSDHPQRKSALAVGVERFAPGIGLREVGVGPVRILFVALRRQNKPEPHLLDFIVGPGPAVGEIDRLPVHRGKHRFVHFLFGAKPQRKQRKVADFVVLVHNQHHFVGSLGPSAALVDQFIFFADQRGDQVGIVLVQRREHLRPDLEPAAHHAAVGGLHRGRAGRAAHAGEPCGHVRLDDFSGAAAQLVALADKNAPVEIVAVADCGEVAVKIRGALQVFLEGGQVVAFGAGRTQRVHQLPQHHAFVNLVAVVVVRAVGIGVHQCVDQRGQVNRFGVQLDGVAGKRVALDRFNVGIHAGGNRQNQRDADDADGPGERGHKGAPLFGHQVVQRQGKRRKEGHGAFLFWLSAAVGPAAQPAELLAPRLLNIDGKRGAALFAEQRRQGGALRLSGAVGLVVADHLTVLDLNDAAGVAPRQVRVMGDHDD